MEPSDKVVETIKFLLASVKKLSDAFVESEARLKSGFQGVASDVEELYQRLEGLERQIAELADISAGQAPATGAAPGRAVETHLPMMPGTEHFRVPALNLSIETIVDVYANTPILLEPFSRPCSPTGRTISGEINEVELEVSPQGSTWVVESRPVGWLLIPRPGSLERKVSLQTLERFYAIEGAGPLPAMLHLIRPAQLDAVVAGRRWQLRERGQLNVTPNPVRVALSERMASLEKRLILLEGQQENG